MARIKRWFCSFLALAVILTLAGCSHTGNRESTLPANAEVFASNEKYSLIQADGAHYLRFQDALKESGALSGEHLIELKLPEFTSVKEMKEAILTGDFSDDELFAISTFDRTDTGLMKMCNLNKLYEADLPDGWSYNKLFWYGDSYSFNFRKGNANGFLRCYSAEEYALRFNGTYATKFDTMAQEDTITVLYRATDPEKNAEVFYYSAYMFTGTLVQYTYELPGRTLYIEELWSGGSPYVMENYDGTLKFDPSLWRIKIWGEQAGGYFECVIMFDLHPLSMPSDEWVQSFGLTPYVETETE